ncbi:MAG: hypothetical protein K2X81_26930, partial [Candidatus Obscuribacterales bacterium]|nr:hypothetical protein [Candidatus Obscuribacterales bacterium]
FGLTEKGKLVASKHNSEKAFYDRSDSHDRKTPFTKTEVKDPSRQVEHNEKHQTFRVQDRNEISHLTGTLTSPDGKQSFRVAQGHVIDSHNKQIAQILADGTLKFPTEQSHRKQEDLNVAFRSYRFEGSENGLSRHFVATNKMADGKMFLPSENNKSTECIVRMGMIIDAHNGQQLGNIVEPPAYHGSKLDPGKIALAGDPSRAISLNNPRFKNAVFDLEIRGQVFDDHRRLQGVCTGDQQKPVIDLHVLTDNQKKAVDLKDRQFQDKMAENTIHALFGDNKPYEEHQAVSDKFIKSASTVNEILRTGHVDMTVLSKMDRDANTIIQAKVIAEQLSKSSFAIPPRPDSEHKGTNESKHFEKDHSKDPIKEKIASKDLGAEKHVREASHPIVGIPEIADLGTASRINGMLRVEEDVYRIKDSKLYHLDHSGKELVESKTASGVLGPGYLFQLNGGKVESLADQNRVLMKFKVEGGHDLGEHLILGLGASYVNKSGEKIQGGLINAKDLSQASLDVAIKVDQSRTNSLEKRNWFDSALSSTVTAGFDSETADKVTNSKDLAIMRASKINDLFRHGFDTNNISAPQFDAQNKDILHLMKDCNLSAVTAEDLIKKHEITNTLIREGIITGAATMVSVAATAATDGAAAPIAATNLARGSELISMARSLGASSAAVGSLNTVLRFKEGKDFGETAIFASRNFGDGALQGLAMKVPAAQIKEVGDIAKASNLGKVVAQTELFQAGQSLRETGSVIPANAQEATGNIVAASALTMLTHGASMQMEKFPFLGNAINDAKTQLARCAQMRLSGGDAAAIEKL